MADGWRSSTAARSRRSRWPEIRPRPSPNSRGSRVAGAGATITPSCSRPPTRRPVYAVYPRPAASQRSSRRRPGPARNGIIFPAMLPGARGVLFTITARSQTLQTQVAVLDLRTGRRAHADSRCQPGRVRRANRIRRIGLPVVRSRRRAAHCPLRSRAPAGGRRLDPGRSTTCKMAITAPPTTPSPDPASWRISLVNRRRRGRSSGWIGTDGKIASTRRCAPMRSTAVARRRTRRGGTAGPGQ